MIYESNCMLIGEEGVNKFGEVMPENIVNNLCIAIKHLNILAK